MFDDNEGVNPSNQNGSTPEESNAGEGGEDLENDQNEDTENEILEMDEEDVIDPDKAEVVKKHLKNAKTLIKQKRHWRDKAKALEASKAPSAERKQEPAKKEAPNTTKPLIDSGARAEFRQDNPDLTREDVDEIQEYAEKMGITLYEAHKRPLIQAYLEKKQSKREINDAVPDSRRKASSNSKPTSGVDWKTATREELEKERKRVARSL